MIGFLYYIYFTPYPKSIRIINLYKIYRCLSTISRINHIPLYTVSSNFAQKSFAVPIHQSAGEARRIAYELNRILRYI